MTTVEFNEIYNSILEMFGNHMLFVMTSNGVQEKETGVIEKITGNTVVIRTDTGRMRFFSISSIFSIEPVEEVASAGLETKPTDFVQVVQKTGTESEEPAPPQQIQANVRNDYSKEITFYFKTDRDAYRKANQIDNILQSALKSHALSEKKGKIRLVTEQFLSEFHAVKEACLYAADILEKIEEYPRAISVYKYCGEVQNAQYCAHCAGDLLLYDRTEPLNYKETCESAMEAESFVPSVCTGIIDNWDRQKIYGAILCNDKIEGNTGNKIFFHLTSVKNRTLREYLYGADEIPYHEVKVTFFPGKFHGKLAATAIEPINLDEVIQENETSARIYKGFLSYYKSYEYYGKVSDGKKDYGFYSSACCDPYLLYYLNNSFNAGDDDLDVLFMLKSHKGKMVVSHLISTDKTIDWISQKFEIYHKYPEFEGKSEEERLLGDLKVFDPNELPEYRELPAWDGVPTDQMEAIPEHTTPRTEQIKPAPLAERTLYAPDELDPYQKGCDLMRFSPEIAKEYFLDSLEKGLRVEAALSNLVSVLNRIEEDPCKEGIPLLEYFGGIMENEKVSNLRISMLEKSKNHEKLVEEIDSVLPIVYNSSKRKHLLWIKSASLFKLQRYGQTVQVLENFINAFDMAENSPASQFAHRMLATSYYLMGDKNRAKKLAHRLLEFNASDEVALNIIHDEVVPMTSNDDLYDFGEQNVQNDRQLKGYCKYKVDSIILDTQIAGCIKKYINDNKIVGDLPALNKAFAKYISDNIKVMPVEAKSKGWAFLAKVLIQLLEDPAYSEANLEENKITYKMANLYAGRAMKSSGDYVALSLSNELDVLRFFYVQTLNLVPEDQNDAENAFNSMISSFYVDRGELQDIVRSVMEKRGIWKKCAKNKKCGSLKSLYISSFMLDDRVNGRIKSLLDCILNNGLESVAEVTSFGGLSDLNHSDKKPDSETYYNNWLNCRREYLDWYQKIVEDLKQVSNELSSSESVTEHISFLDDIIRRDALLPLDQNNLGRIKEYLRRINQASSTDDFLDREGIYKQILSDCNALEETITQSPTSLSFEYIREVARSLSLFALEKLNELYDHYLPCLELYCSLGYSNDHVVPIYFKIKNGYNLQTAEISTIDFIPSIAGIKIHKYDAGRILNVKGNEEREGTREIHIESDQFPEYVEFDMKVCYRYKASSEKTVTSECTKSFHLELRDNSQFVQIKNRYKKHVKSNAVTDDMFRGRDDEIWRITSMLQVGGDMLSHRGIVMYGQKRAGKSSILQNLQKNIEHRYGYDTYLFFDIGSLGEVIQTDRVNGILSTFLFRIRHTLSRNYRDVYNRLVEDGYMFPTTDEENAWRLNGQYILMFNQKFKELSELLEEYGGKNKYIPMFFVDEFTYIYQWIKEGNDATIRDFPHFWKAFLQNNRICSIVIGQDNMPIFMNLPQYSNDFGCMEQWPVTYLNEAGARELIEDPMRKDDGTSRFNEAAIEMMLNWTAGSAFLIVQLCSSLIEFMNESRLELVTPLVMRQFLKRFLQTTQDWKLIFEAQINDPSKVGEEGEITANDNKKLLQLIACRCDEQGYIPRAAIAGLCLTDPSDAYRNRLLDALVRRDVLTLNRNKESVRIKIDLLRIFLRRDAGEDIEELV